MLVPETPVAGVIGSQKIRLEGCVSDEQTHGGVEEMYHQTIYMARSRSVETPLCKGTSRVARRRVGFNACRVYTAALQYISNLNT